MNEKTKRILSYVACTLGGVALGIALLGGLSMCSVSEKAEQTEVNTILTEPKKAQITTDEGGYTGYSFSLATNWTSAQGSGHSYIYDVDTSNYTLTLASSTTHSSLTSYSKIREAIQTTYGNGASSTPNALRFMATYVTLDYLNQSTAGYFAYFSFLLPNASSNLTPLPFLLATNWANAKAFKFDASYWVYSSSQNLLILNQEQSGIILYDYLSQSVPLATITFQDVKSYYQELGYQDGYNDGEQVGYDSGYADGFEDGADNGLLFTDLGVNQLTWASADLSWDDSTDTTQTMKLFDFKDGENSSYYVTLTDYSLGGGNASVQVFKNGTASNNIYATIARGTWNGAYTQLEVIPSNYLKFEFAQITTYYHNSIPNGWFTLSGIPANATGYDVGYQTGYREGYLASPGGQATENVFSLFTNAFDSVGGIFNLKIFGFLPLYWFFLTPIFIAIIALLLRLVKH